MQESLAGEFLEYQKTDTISPIFHQSGLVPLSVSLLCPQKWFVYYDMWLQDALWWKMCYKISILKDNLMEKNLNSNTLQLATPEW